MAKLRLRSMMRNSGKLVNENKRCIRLNDLVHGKFSKTCHNRHQKRILLGNHFMKLTEKMKYNQVLPFFVNVVLKGNHIKVIVK